MIRGVHGEKLVSVLNSDKLPVDEVERIEDAIKVYDDWIIELNEADGDSVTDLIFNMVELLNEYKRFIDLDLIFDSPNDFYSQKKKEISQTESLRILDGFIPSLWSVKDDAVKDINSIENSKMEVSTVEKNKEEDDRVKETGEGLQTQRKKHIKKAYRQALFPAKTLENENEIREYLKTVKKNLMSLLGDCDGIEIN